MEFTTQRTLRNWQISWPAVLQLKQGWPLPGSPLQRIFRLRQRPHCKQTLVESRMFPRGLGTYRDWYASSRSGVRFLLGTLLIVQVVRRTVLPSIGIMVRCGKCLVAVVVQRIAMSAVAVSVSELLILIVICSPSYHLSVD